MTTAVALEYIVRRRKEIREQEQSERGQVEDIALREGIKRTNDELTQGASSKDAKDEQERSNVLLGASRRVDRFQFNLGML